MVRHSNPEVLVVGAGPVGLVAALFLEPLLQQIGLTAAPSGRGAGVGA